jgi:uncharacterized phosphosugar-binding protein
MSKIYQQYLDAVVKQLNAVVDETASEIEKAAEVISQAIIDDQNYFLFGSGHSALIAREAFWRAGGLAPAMPIPDIMEGDVERLPGHGLAILAHYNLQKGDVIVIISNSGINYLPLEIAMKCKEMGMTVIALTSKHHSANVDPRHPSGKRLMDIADIVIDNQVVRGDALISLSDEKYKVGPSSTILGAFIIEAMTARAAELMLDKGFEPPLLITANAPGGDEHNKIVAAKYRDKLIRYAVPTVDAK